MPKEQIDRTVQHWNTALQIVCISATTLCVALRVYTRMFVFNGLAKEDVGYHGGGLHVDDVSDHNQRIFRKTVYGTMIIYGPAAYLTKVCLLWIMTRVFHPFRKAVIFIYLFLGLMLAYYVPALIVKICICIPISKFWAPATPGRCLDQSKITLADAVISVVSDLIVLIIPLALVSTLHLPTRKKVRVIALLSAGGLACASSIARLIRAVIYGQGEHFGSSGNAIEIFRTVEISTEVTSV
ncbi:hypothetical protein BDV27DRAFT_144772 [Aspergillus caelatus]|uniref:Rhodopsin domain-containing protein n=1 Tax=Aspergillus caelatus TaxID=61420 RepID=A0A5N7A647_9EURO|nr:uncharacterized protein BDV27DRAFT_144772 [Aspergillus caelatus]KAE8365073.1 hypothetical protein BDV27DRAFT_144772 [Aspergillus caelatus]